MLKIDRFNYEISLRIHTSQNGYVNTVIFKSGFFIASKAKQSGASSQSRASFHSQKRTFKQRGISETIVIFHVYFGTIFSIFERKINICDEPA